MTERPVCRLAPEPLRFARAGRLTIKTSQSCWTIIVVQHTRSTTIGFSGPKAKRYPYAVSFTKSLRVGTTTQPHRGTVSPLRRWMQSPTTGTFSLLAAAAASHILFAGLTGLTFLKSICLPGLYRFPSSPTKGRCPHTVSLRSTESSAAMAALWPAKFKWQYRALILPKNVPPSTKTRREQRTRPRGRRAELRDEKPHLGSVAPLANVSTC